MPARRASLRAAGNLSKRAKVETDDEEAAASGSDFDEAEADASSAKAHKKSRKGQAPLAASIVLDGLLAAPVNLDASLPPKRIHTFAYHAPLLLSSTSASPSASSTLGESSREALLTWFDGVREKRAMPWRKTWIDPATFRGSGEELNEALKKRAYEVWISEIMLQQTRVSTVIDYWTSWISKWPTIEDLAAASHDDVLSAWRGLGYYSRATRIHTAAKKVVLDGTMKGLLPSRSEDLERDVPGIGPYTAGAISSIVFGRPAAMVDGNVMRVLSRQMGLFADLKTKAASDLIWETARRLAKAVMPEGSDEESLSERPGLWGQALMELGSTVCTPKPNCSDCPIRSSCRANAEGEALAISKGLMTPSQARSGAHHASKTKGEPAVPDIESCHLCVSMEDPALMEAAGAVDEDAEDEGAETKGKASKKASAVTSKAAKKQATLAAFAFTGARSSTKPQKEAKLGTDAAETQVLPPKAQECIEAHARLFPLKVPKKKVREEHCVVLCVRRADGCFLLEQRPETGLLASLWEFPSTTLASTHDGSAKALIRTAQESWQSLLVKKEKEVGPKPLYLGALPHVFSHLKLTMHVHLLVLPSDAEAREKPHDKGQKRKWASMEQVESESMGTGMRRCWTLVLENL